MSAMCPKDSDGVFAPFRNRSDFTPTQPSPLEGEGYLWTTPCR